MTRTTLSLVIWLAVAACVLAEDKPNSAVERLDPSFDKLVPPGASVELLAGGFKWSEGPVWVKDGGYLLFSDIPNNRIVKWTEDIGVSIFLEPSGYTGSEPFTGEEPGTNGLAIDAAGMLCMCEHGNRQVSRLNKDGSRTILASHYDGKRFNSPNDLVWHSSGDLYFTDPPYGLPKRYNDPARELDWCGVYRRAKDGNITLLTKSLDRPNGIALSPDEKTLYVAQSKGDAAIYTAFPVTDDGTLGKGNVIFDATKWAGRKDRPGSPDGMTIDKDGRLWASGPGGILVLTPKGKLLGRISTGERTANCCFGDDGSTLYMTADDYLCRIRTNTKGLGF